MRIALALIFGLGPSLTVADPFDFETLDAHQIVIIGEVHDNPDHHLFQADAIRHLEPTAVVFEMLSGEDAVIANAPDMTMQALPDAVDWAQSGWPAFEVYAPIFDVIGFEAQIYGAEVSREAAQQVFVEGPIAVIGADAARFELDAPLPDAQQAAREALQLEAHCGALPPEILPGFVDVQRLRDAVLAQQAILALDETGGPVVVITGNGHARRDWGVPATIAVAAADISVVSIGQLEVAGDPVPFDLVRLSDPIERPDPCAAFAE